MKTHIITFILLLGLLPSLLSAPAWGQQKRQSITVTVGGCSFEMLYVGGGYYVRGYKPVRESYFEPTSTHLIEEAATFVDEIPRHRVDLYGFYLARYEVTQRLWKAVMGYNPSNFVGDDLPVEQVSYPEVQEFIRRLNQLTGLTFRLPTEAEWEYAARGGRESKGYACPGGEDYMKIGWSLINSGDSTHIVGSLIPNELGLYDMSGNVWEWCSDWYDTLAYLRVFSEHLGRTKSVMTNAELLKWYQAYKRQNGMRLTLSDEHLNPCGPDTGEFRVGRGGSWSDETKYLRSSYRNFWVPEMKLSNLGFRLALSQADDSSLICMPNQYVIDSVVDGKAYATPTTAILRRLQQGALEGLFSVSADSRIRFSKGNLQYNAAADQWRFADRQYDRIGESNEKCEKDYAGWIDLFAWGTSGYRGKTPYYYATQPKAYGRGKRNIDGTSYDWGVYNSISNGGDREGIWRTLTVAEWKYLLIGRPNARLLRSQATIEGVEGLVLLPDDWLERGFDTLSIAMLYDISAKQWKLLEWAGAVFLPAGGNCYMGLYHLGKKVTTAAEVIDGNGFAVEGLDVSFGTFRPQPSVPVNNTSPVFNMPVSDDEEGPVSKAEKEFYGKARYHESGEDDSQYGYYWTTIYSEDRSAYGVVFNTQLFSLILPIERLTRCSVRLVQDAKE